MVEPGCRVASVNLPRKRDNAIPNRIYDYVALKEQFVRGEMSVRELAKLNGIAEARVSSVHDQARKPDAKGRTWYDLREEYKSRSTDKAIELLSAREARRQLREAEVRDNAIDGIDEAISKMRADMRRTRRVKTGGVDAQGEAIWTTEPLMTIYPKDLAILLDKLMPLLGRPSLITEDRHLGAIVHSADASLGVAALARLTAEARTRSRQPEPRRVGGSEAGDAAEPRTN